MNYTPILKRVKQKTYDIPIEESDESSSDDEINLEDI